MKTILVPTDYSRNATNALRYALQIARHSGASIRLIHVVTPYEHLDKPETQTLWFDEYMAGRRKQLTGVVRRIKAREAYAGVDIDAEIRVGHPVAQIVKAAETLRADLIVIGTTGQTGVRGWLVGSTAGGVLEKTTVPVLVVPPKARFQGFANIALASDFEVFPDTRSMAALRNVLDVDLEKTRIHVVHILNRLGEAVDPGAEQRFIRAIPGLDPTFHYQRGSDVAGDLAAFLDASKAECIVTIARRHNVMSRLFSGSVSRELAKRVAVPLLVLHEA